MHASIAVLSSILLLAAAAFPASAQLSGGVGSSNATNQSFQLQNQIRGVQQQQTFQNNQTRMQIDRNRLYDSPRTTDGLVRRRR